MRPIVLLAAALALLLVLRADASVGLRAEVEDLAEAADLVADAVVLRHTASLDADTGSITTTWRLRVARTIAGEAGPELDVRTQGGTVGSVTQEVLGAPTFADGDRVVVFLAPAAAGSRGVVGLAQGAFHVTTDADSGAVTCRNGSAGLSLVGPDGAPSAEGPIELSIADLAARVTTGRERAEARRRAAREATLRKLALWRRAAERREPATRGRPGGSPP